MSREHRRKTEKESKKPGIHFDRLVGLFEQTHTALQQRAARSMDIALVVRNWLFGWYIVEFEQAGAERAELYGKKLLQRLSVKLKKFGIKGVSVTNLKQCRLFYQAYSDIGQALTDQCHHATDLRNIDARERTDARGGDMIQMSQAAPDQSESGRYVLPDIIKQISSRFVLGWTHYVTLLRVKDAEERRFYEIETAENGWGYRELERQINSALYQRLALSRDKEAVKELAEKGQIVEKPSDVIKNPYILEFTGLEEKSVYNEYDLETALINKIEHFLLELGKGFLFEARQKRFSFDNRHFYVDLVFYNRLLRCYVLVDLKVGDLKHQDLGQMQMYVNYFDRYVKTDDENPTAGILLCLSKSDELVKLTLPENSNIHASEYQLYLPSAEELRRQLEEARQSRENRE